MIEIRHSCVVPASKEAVIAGLANLDVIKFSIPGCSQLRRVSDNLFWGHANIGFMKMRFDVDATLEVLSSSQGYRATGSVRAGPVTAGTIDADIMLRDEGPRTRVDSATKVFPARSHSSVVLKAGRAIATKLLNLFFKRFTVALSQQGPTTK